MQTTEVILQKQRETVTLFNTVLSKLTEYYKDLFKDELQSFTDRFDNIVVSNYFSNSIEIGFYSKNSDKFILYQWFGNKNFIVHSYNKVNDFSNVFDFSNIDYNSLVYFMSIVQTLIIFGE